LGTKQNVVVSIRNPLECIPSWIVYNKDKRINRAEKNIEWEYCKTTEEAIKKLKKEKVQIVALEQAENSVDYKKVKSKESTAIILGEEVHGLSKEILILADIVAEIPMKGKKESLNVSVAFGVAGYNFWGECCTTRAFPFSNRFTQEN
jgi:tRNA(Leu) C34 or U34 (ribose-2'-O)-methylase TrmL